MDRDDDLIIAIERLALTFAIVAVTAIAVVGLGVLDRVLDHSRNR